MNTTRSQSRINFTYVLLLVVFFIWGLYLSNLSKNYKRGIQRFCIWSLQFEQFGKWGSKLGKNVKLLTTLQTRSREQSHARGKHARLETFYFYLLPSPNVNSLGDDLFLSFVFCYRSLQIATNAKSICQSLWRCSKHPYELQKLII